MLPMEGRPDGRIDGNGSGLDGPDLDDCRVLISRIDDTLAALRRERARLEARAGTLVAASGRNEAANGC